LPDVEEFLPSFSLELKGILCKFSWGICPRFNAFQSFISHARSVRLSAPCCNSLLGFPPPRHRWSPNQPRTRCRNKLYPPLHDHSGFPAMKNHCVRFGTVLFMHIYTKNVGKKRQRSKHCSMKLAGHN